MKVIEMMLNVKPLLKKINISFIVTLLIGEMIKQPKES